MAITFIGCNSDDDNSTPPDNQSSILSKWYYKNIIIDGEVIPYDDHEGCGKDYIEFYDVDKIRSIDVWNCEEDLDWEANFFLTNNMLSIVDEGITTTAQVLELTETKLSYTYTMDLDDDGVEETLVENFDSE